MEKVEVWAKQLGRGCQKYIRRVQRNIERIFHWKKDGFLYLFAFWAKSLLTSAKHLRQGFRDFNLRVRRKTLREKKWKEKGDFVVFLYFEFKKIGLWAKQFGRGCQSCIPSVQRNLLRIFFEKTMIFEWISYFERKCSWFCQKLTAGCLKLQSTCPEKVFRDKKMKKWWFPSNFVLWVNKTDFGWKSLAWVVIAAFGVSRGIFWAVLFGKTMIFDWFSYFERKCSGLCQKLTAGCLKLQPTCQEKNCEREKNWKNDSFSVFLYFEWKKIGLWAKQLGRCCQNYIRRVWGFFIQKKMIFHIFSHCEQNHCWLLPNNYGRISKTSIYVSGKIFERKKNWPKEDFLKILYFELKKMDFGQNSLAGVVKVAFGVSRGIFSAFSIGKKMIFEWFSHSERKSSGLCRNFTAGFPKFQSTCPVKNFERKKWQKKMISW